MTPEYKAAKEASVSHLGGGKIWEINHVALVVPAAYFLWAMLQSRQSFFKKYDLPIFIADFLMQCCAILFACTIYSSAPQILNGLLILPALAALLQHSSPADHPFALNTGKKPPTLDSKVDATTDGIEIDAIEDDLVFRDDKDPLPVKPFITTYRGAMMIITCACILAVDFPSVFPRRFAKTETFGTSLMDLGVGNFVFAAGIVAARQQLKEEAQPKLRSMISRLRTSMRHALPLLVIGLARVFSVKSLDYAEHVSEYGVHWNFFFTLALLSPVVAILQPVLRLFKSYTLLAFILAVSYELVLFLTPGMKAWLLLSARIPGDFLSENREGIFSFLGYLAIFLAGTGVGMNILRRDPGPDDLPLPDGQDALEEDDEWLAEVLGGGPSGDVVLTKAAEEASSTGTSKAPAQKRKANPLPDPATMFRPELPNHALGRLGAWSLLWFILAGWALWRYGPRLYVSRRMANLGYVTWVCSFNTAQLFLFCLIETIMFPTVYAARNRAAEKKRANIATSRVLRAFNRNGLALFLLANLLTGAVNVLVNTLEVPEVPAMAILIGYLLVLTGVAVGLDHANIDVKL